jgi:hypothetical protein
MRHDPTQLGTLEPARRPLVLDEIALIQQDGGGMCDVRSFLYESAIVFLIIHSNAIQSGALKHANVPVAEEHQYEIYTAHYCNVQIGVSKPLHGFVPIPDGTQDYFRVQVIRQFRHEL